MTRRILAVSLWVIGSISALVLLMVGVFIWRLATGPVPVGFLLPSIGSLFVDGLSPRQLEVQDAWLAWEAEADRLTLRASGVRLVTAAGTPLATSQVAVVSLSQQALMSGKLAPTALTLEGADIRLTRQADGTLYVGAASQDGFVISVPEPTGAQNVWHLLTQVAETLMSAPRLSQPLTYLQDIRLRHSTFAVEDRRLGLTWHAAQADVTFQRDHSSLTGHLQVVASVQNQPTTFALHLSSTAPLKQLKLDLTFTDLLPAMLATVVPTLQPLSTVDIPFTGTLNATLQPQSAFPTFRFALSGRRQTTGPRFDLSGTAEAIANDLTLRGLVTLKAFPIADLKHYWPPNVGHKARAWLVENLVAGSVPQGRMNIVVRLPGGDIKAAHVEHLDGALDYQGCEVHYLRPLPPIRQVQGHATFDQQGWRIHVESGSGENLRVTHGEVTITGLDRRRDAIAIRVGVETPLQAALTLLDHPRLKVRSPLPVEPAAVNGHATVETVFAFPLRGRVTLDKVDLQVHGRLTDVAIQSVFRGQTAERGQLGLRLDRQALRLEGSIDFAATPLALEWTETFSADAAWKRQIEVAASRLHSADLARLGLDLQGFVEGGLPTTMTVQFGRHGHGQVHTRVNLQEAKLALPFVGWHKAAGEPGEASGVLQLAAGGVVGIDTIRLQAGTLSTRGSAQFGQPGMTFQGLKLADLAIDNSHVQDVSMQRQGEGYSITIGAGTLDVQPFLRSQPSRHTFPLRIHAPRLRRVSFGQEHYLQEVEALLMRSPAGWEHIEVVGSIPAALVRQTKSEAAAIQQGQPPRSRTITVRYRPSSTGTYELSVETKDVGSALRALDLADDIIEGTLGIAGNTVGRHPTDLLQGTIDMRNFMVRGAPVLAHILAAVSLTGLVDVLSGEGLHFARLYGDFTLHHGVVTTKLLRTYGRALGLTAQGAINLSAGTLDLKGTIAPFNEINRLLDKIPVLGDILVGSKGEGILAVNYHLTGPIGSPKVTVNPASVLTPGFLRGIFDLFDATEKTPTEPPAPDQ